MKFLRNIYFYFILFTLDGTYNKLTINIPNITFIFILLWQIQNLLGLPKTQSMIENNVDLIRSSIKQVTNQINRNIKETEIFVQNNDIHGKSKCIISIAKQQLSA